MPDPHVPIYAQQQRRRPWQKQRGPLLHSVVPAPYPATLIAPLLLR